MELRIAQRPRRQPQQEPPPIATTTRQGPPVGAGWRCHGAGASGPHAGIQRYPARRLETFPRRPFLAVRARRFIQPPSSAADFRDDVANVLRPRVGCRAYLRHVDDFALFDDSPRRLYEWKTRIVERLAALRLTVHEGAAHVVPTRCGIPWLGFVVHPGRLRVKRRKVVEARRRLGERLGAWQRGDISFAEFYASVRGWVNHVGHGDTAGLQRSVLASLER